MTTQHAPIFLEGAAYHNHPLVTGGVIHMMPVARVAEYKDDEQGVWGLRLHVPEEMAQVVEATVPILQSLPYSQRIIHIAGAMEKQTAPNGERIHGAAIDGGRVANFCRELHKRKAAPKYAYLDYETTDDPATVQSVIDGYQAFSGLGILCWACAAIPTGWDMNPHNRPAFNVRVSNLVYTSGGVQILPRVKQELSSCPGPKFVHLNAACPLDFNQALLQTIGPLLNPATDGIILFVDDNPGDNSTVPGLGMKRLDDLVPVLSAFAGRAT